MTKVPTPGIVRARRLATCLLAACMLAAAPPTSARGEDTMPQDRVAAAIARTRQQLKRRLGAATRAVRDGKTDDAWEEMDKAVTTLQACVRASFLIVGKPPPKLTEDASPVPPPVATPPGPPAAAPSAYPLTKSYDRFTGEARVSVAPLSLQTRHKDTQRPAALVVQFLAEQSEGLPGSYGFVFASDDAPLGPRRALRPGESVRAYFLIDGERSQDTLPFSASGMASDYLQVVVLRLEPARLARMLSATKVEMRLGEYEFEIAADYRRAAAAAVAALEDLQR